MAPHRTQSNTARKSTAHLKRSPHYIADLRVFRVGDTLHRIPENILRTSPYFKELLDVEKPNLGRSDDDPIVLDVISKDMESFLTALYSRVTGKGELSTIDESLGALSLATEWSFDSVRDYAINQIEQQCHGRNAFARLAIADAFNVEKWKLPAYVAICERKEPLTAEEGQKLGFHRFSALCRTREKLAARKNSERVSGNSIESLIRREPDLAVPALEVSSKVTREALVVTGSDEDYESDDPLVLMLSSPPRSALPDSPVSTIATNGRRKFRVPE